MPFPGLPSLVCKRDGRLVPFEADKISQSLYAATEDLGQPSAFMARELTDGVLHFLAAEVDAEPPTTAQIADLVTKVVRELGQPALAQVYAEGQRRLHQEAPAAISQEKSARSAGTITFSMKDAPQAVVRQCLISFSLQAVFGRDLAAAHEEGLLSLSGLEYPDEFARYLMEPGDGLNGWLPFLNTPARTLIFDSPEYTLTEETARPWLQGLAELCEATGRVALLNLNVSPPPVWANASPQGPLFAPVDVSTDANSSAGMATLLLEEALQRNKSFLRINWHGRDSDFAQENAPRLESMRRRAGEGKVLAFTLDKPKKTVVLAPGVDRQHAAALLDVGLDLLRFLTMPGIENDARLFLDKLPSLARMAVRAGVQKRNYLRSRSHDHPGLARGFLLERAYLVVMPLGLDKVVAGLLGMATGKLSLDLRRQIIEILQSALQSESQATNLEIALDDQADGY